MSITARAADLERGDTLETGLTVRVIPLVAYFPETRFMGVLTAFLTYRTEADAAHRASSSAVALQATQNEQFVIGVYPEIYLDSNRMRIEGSAEAYLYPFRFYGLGNTNPESNAELYTPIGTRVQLRALHALSGRMVQHGLSIGLRFDVRYDHIRSVDLRDDGTAGPLRQGVVTGSNGGWFNGLGPLVSYDTRDNNFDARSGLFCEASIVPYGSFLGSSYTATLSTIDLRAYAEIDSGWSIATRAYVQNAAGTPTFQMWPFIGGNSMLRGVYEAQQRDRMSALVTAETRFPIVWKFRGVVFVDAGHVAPTPSAFTLPGVWVGWGGGVRFVFDEKERVSLRLDVGVARGVPQFYLAFNEAL